MQVLIEAQPEVIAMWWFYMGREDSYTDLSGGGLITSLNNRFVGFFKKCFPRCFPKILFMQIIIKK